MTSLALACKLNAVNAPRSRVAKMVSALRRIGGTLFYVPDNVLGDGAPNLLTAPEDFSDAVWTKASAAIVPESGTAPDGTTSAQRFYPTSTGAFRVVRRASGVGNPWSATSTFTIHAKAAGLTRIGFLNAAGNSAGASVNLTTGTVTIVDASLAVSIDALPDGWYRCKVTALTGWVYAYLTDTDTGVTVTASGTSGIYIWGAKLERGSVATPYTPQSVLRQRGSFVDSTGTTPVTAVGDLFGLITDKSYGGQLGVNRVNNGDFSAGTAEWTVPGGWALSSGAMVATSASSSLLQQGAVSTVGRSYEVEFDWTHTGGTLYVRVGVGTAVTFASSGRKRVILVAASTAGIEFYGGAVSGTLGNITSKEVPGNHATQSAVASKPSLQRVPKRVGPNLVVNGAFDSDTSWTKGGGWTISGGKAVRSPSAFGSVLSQPISVTAEKSYVVTYTLADRVAGSPNVAFAGGTVVNGPPRAANGTYSDTLLALPGNNALWIVTGDNTSSLSIDNIEVREVLEWANVISFDGSNDFLQTGISTGNEGWVCAGVTLGTTGIGHHLFGNGGASATDVGVWLRIASTNNTATLLVSNGTTREITSAVTSTLTGAPKVIDGGWGAATMFAAVDGVETSIAKTVNCTTSKTCQIGGSNSVGWYTNGTMHAEVYTPVLPDAATRKIIRDGIAALQGRTL